MKGIRHLIHSCFLPIVALALASDGNASSRWQVPFDTANVSVEDVDSVLSLSDAIRLTALKNPTLKSLNFERLAAEAQLEQAGLWSNPEVELEFEGVGWDAPGLRESEMTLSIAQEFELFGQRGARKQLARAEIDAAEFLVRVAAFDLYLEVKRRYYTLAHARQHLHLSQTAITLAEDVVQNITSRINRGAGLQSELLLAQLEKQRAQQLLEEAQQQVTVAEAVLVALWDGQPDGVRVPAISEPEPAEHARLVSILERYSDSTRTTIELQRQSEILRAEESLAAAESRPNITLRGGYKRVETDNSNTLLFSVSLPLPLLNRNQGARASLKARLRSLDYRAVRERLDAMTGIRVQSARLLQSVRKHDILDSLLVPTAEDAYETLRRAYEAGRLPYTQLLEAERSLNELRFEHNDLLLAIHEQVIELERITGVAHRSEREN